MEDAPDPRAKPRTARREDSGDAAPPPAEDALTRFNEASAGFEDLPPGDYLREQRVGVANVIWTALNLAIAVIVSWAWFQGALSAESQWRFLASFAWTLLPVSCEIVFVVSIWQLAVGDRDQPRWPVVLSLSLDLLAIAIWWRAKDWGGVSFAA